MRRSKRGPSILGTQDSKVLGRYGPMDSGIAGRNRSRRAISPRDKLPGVGAGPFLCPIILAAGQRKVWIGRVDGAVVELGERKVRVVVGPGGTAVTGAPDPAVGAAQPGRAPGGSGRPAREGGQTDHEC